MREKGEQKMTFETFVKNVTEDIKNYLPEEFADAEVKVFPYEKLNESYTGMIVIQPGKKQARSSVWIFIMKNCQKMYAVKKRMNIKTKLKISLR